MERHGKAWNGLIGAARPTECTVHNCTLHTKGHLQQPTVPYSMAYTDSQPLGNVKYSIGKNYVFQTKVLPVCIEKYFIVVNLKR